MLLIKLRSLIFLIFCCWYGLACKFRIISQTSIYIRMLNCMFWYFWYCIFILLRSGYSSQAMSTCCDKWDGLSHGELRAVLSAQIAILNRASSKIEFWLRIWLVFISNSYSYTTKKRINNKKHLTINKIKLNFVKKTSSMLYLVKRETPEMLSATEILSASTVTR